ncbi:MAG: HAD family hydrolase [Actinomycetota bacterium]|nr:HAD family hydrolase [Actinomycetota bacterium]
MSTCAEGRAGDEAHAAPDDLPPAHATSTGTTTHLSMWSGPRNISTAMMRAWENRPDCFVVDEPLYAAYLQATRLDHPGRDEIIAAGETDWRAVADWLLGATPDGSPIFFSKMMTHHLIPQVGREWIASLRNVLLIRDPREVVASYVRSRASCEPADVGVLQQAELYDELVEAGVDVPIIDAADFLRDPRRYLTWLCEWLDVTMTESMLSWPIGPRASDGVWAPHWYAAVVASTGFEPWRPREILLDAHDEEVVEECRGAYERLHGRRLTAADR